MLGAAYYSDSAIQVTDQWVKMKDTAYQVADIKSVKLAKVPIDPLLRLARILIISGLLVALVVGVTYLMILSQGMEGNLIITFIGILAVNNLVIGLLLREFRKPEYLYVLTLSGPFGKRDAIGSRDEGYVRRIADAINDAVRNYRRAKH